MYYNQSGDRIDKYIPSVQGDYGRIYDTVYETLVNGKPKLVSDETMITVMRLLSGGLQTTGPHILKF